MIIIDTRYYRIRILNFLIINIYVKLQSLNAPNAATILIKSMLYYITMNLEAFIYCLSGEYLSAKVRHREKYTSVIRKNILNNLRNFGFLFFSEQDDRERGVRFSLVRLPG